MYQFEGTELLKGQFDNPSTTPGIKGLIPHLLNHSQGSHFVAMQLQVAMLNPLLYHRAWGGGHKLLTHFEEQQSCSPLTRDYARVTFS